MSKTPGIQTTFKVEAVAGQILCELNALADPKKAESSQRFFTEPIQTLGIDTPVLRRLTRTWIQRLMVSWHMKEAVALCDRLLEYPHLEERAAGFLVLAGFHNEFDRHLFHRAERWLHRYLDNWALVDGFASAVLSPLIRLYPDLVAELPGWTKSTSMWVRRAAVVALVPFARHGEQLEVAYDLAAMLLGEKEDLLHKAVGWLLREAGKADSARLKAFLLRHRAAIPRTTVRYALERYPAGERQQLLERTKHKCGLPACANKP